MFWPLRKDVCNGVFCKCLSFWDSVEPGSAHCSAMGEGCTVVELMWLCCREKWESDPFQGGSVRTPGSCIHTGLKSASGEQLHSHSTTSKEFLLLASVCPVAWIRGSGIQPWVWPFGNYKRKEPRGTSGAWGGTQDFLHSTLGVGVLQEVKRRDGYFFSALKSRTIPAMRDFVLKERNQHHVRKIPSQVQKWNRPMQWVACTRKRSHLHMQLRCLLLNLRVSNFLYWTI